MGAENFRPHLRISDKALQGNQSTSLDASQSPADMGGLHKGGKCCPGLQLRICFGKLQLPSTFKAPMSHGVTLGWAGRWTLTSLNGPPMLCCPGGLGRGFNLWECHHCCWEFASEDVSVWALLSFLFSPSSAKGVHGMEETSLPVLGGSWGVSRAFLR